VREVLVSGGRTALVDDVMFSLVVGSAWYYRPSKNTGYTARIVVADGRKHWQFMHTLVTGWPRVDHQDHNGLNNQLFNLREASTSQNLRNTTARSATSRFKGVGWHAASSSWRARIYVRGHRLALGRFAEEHLAARAYDAAAREHFGEWAALNFPLPGEVSALPVTPA